MNPASNNTCTCKTTALSSNEIAIQFLVGGIAATCRDVYGLLQRSRQFRNCVIESLAAVPFQGFFWECMPVTTAQLQREFECVVVNAPVLLRPPDSQAFSQYFHGIDHDCSVVVFSNLGKDASLVVPTPAGPDTWYGHLGQFIRNADPAQVHELWRRVGAEMLGSVDRNPLWLSTSGAGISWLHMRLDTFPKYYMYKPYRNAASEHWRQ